MIAVKVPAAIVGWLCPSSGHPTAGANGALHLLSNRSVKCRWRSASCVVHAAAAAGGSGGGDAREQQQRPRRTAIEASRAFAALRAARDADVHAATLAGLPAPAPPPRRPPRPGPPAGLTTRLLDAMLLRCVSTINLERTSRSARETNQVVLLGDGYDTRPFRLPWPPGTVIFLAAPGEVGPSLGLWPWGGAGRGAGAQGAAPLLQWGLSGGGGWWRERHG